MRESVKKSTELFLCRRSFSEAVRPACLAIVKPWRDDGGSDCSELILIKASSNGIVRCGLSLNHNLQPKEEAQ
jgi:hypothetical protein